MLFCALRDHGDGHSRHKGIALRYQAQGFSPDLPNGRASGWLTIENGSVVFATDQQRIVLPGSRLTMRLGGASDRLIFFEHESLPKTSIYTADRKILKDAGLLDLPEIDEQLRGVSKKSRKKVYAWLTAAAIVVAIPLVFVMSLSAMTRFAASKIPVTWERQLGESALSQYRLEYDLVQLQEMDQLAALLQQAQTGERQYDFDFYISDDDSLNAFAAPGGVVVVHSGLILKADSGEELMGVLAHEVSHVTAQHGTRGIINSLGWLVLIQAVFGDVSGVAGVMVQSAPFVINMQYSQSYENEADELGVALLEDARIDPKGLESFFEKLIQERERHPEAAALERQLAFLSSHPLTEDRIENINDLTAEARGGYQKLDRQFAALQQAVKDWQEQSPTERLGEGE